MRKFTATLYLRFADFSIIELGPGRLADIWKAAHEAIPAGPYREGALDVVRETICQWRNSIARSEVATVIGSSGSDPDFAIDIWLVK